MSNLVPFESAALPAHIKAAPVSNLFGFDGASYPVISIKGKVFTIVEGEDRTLVTKPGADDEPAPALEVVILDASPRGGHYAKTFYAGGYVEGSTEKPVCSSRDGITPDAKAPEPQANKCALCPQNVKGSGASQQNPEGKACRSSKVLALAPAGQLDRVMMLRVPGASTLALKDYGAMLAKRGVFPYQVVTKIGFDYTVAHPALTFKPVGFVTAEMVTEIDAQRVGDVVQAITGLKPDGTPVDQNTTAPAAPAETPAAPIAHQAAVKPAAPAKPKSTVKQAVKPAPTDDDLPTAPRTTATVESEAPPAKAATTAAPKPDPVAVNDDEGLESALAGLDFDD